MRAAILLAFFALLPRPVLAQDGDDKPRLRPWMPADASAVRQYAADLDHTEMPRAAIQSEGSGVLVSPNEKYFAVVSQLGDVQTGTYTSSLLVYEIRGASKRSPIARATFGGPVERSQQFGRNGISLLGPMGLNRVRWEPDSRGVQFLGLSSSGNIQPFRLDLSSSSVHQLMKADRPLEFFESRGGTAIVKYAWDSLLGAPVPSGAKFPIEAVKRNPMNGWRVALADLVGYDSPQQYYAVYGGQSYSIASFISAAISPNGKMAVVYGFNKLQGQCEFHLLEFDSGVPPKSLADGKLDCVVFKAFWMPDGKHVVMAGLPDERSSGSEATQPVSSRISAFGVDDRSWHDLGSFPSVTIIGSRWFEPECKLVIETSGAPERSGRLAFRFTGENWERLGPPQGKGGTEVRIRESENNPPTIVVNESGHEQLLGASDPALQGVQLFPVSLFSWREFDGKIGQAGLVLPANFRPGLPVPVVIQPHFYLPGQFKPEGVASTGFAAQSLAARGIATVIMEGVPAIKNTELIPGSQMKRSVHPDGPKFALQMDALIDALVEQGIARPDAVALNGFSRGGYRSFYALTHPRRSFYATVAVNDSTTDSYQQFLWTAAAVTEPTVMYSAVNRTPWQDPRYWLQHDVLLNSDRVHVPMLFSETEGWDKTPYSQISIQTIGALTENSVPFEYLYLDRANHNLNSPLQQSLLRDANVDWFAFWMKGEVDPLPSKSIQYRRWKKLRDDWQSTQAKSITNGEPGFITTRSGMAYRLNTRKSGEVAQPGDELIIQYTARFPDGSAVDGLAMAAKHIVLGESHLGEGDGVSDYEGLKGLDEGLRQMHVGEKATFLYPYDRFPGGKEAPPKSWQQIGPKGPVRYEVEVLELHRKAHAQVTSAS